MCGPRCPGSCAGLLQPPESSHLEDEGREIVQLHQYCSLFRAAGEDDSGLPRDAKPSIFPTSSYGRPDMTDLTAAGTFPLGNRTVNRLGYGAMQLAGPG